MSSILLVRYHPAAVQADACLFGSLGIEKIITAHDGDSGYEAYVDHKPNVSIIDTSADGSEMDGLSLIRRMRLRDAGARVLVLSMRSDRDGFLSAIEAGATSYVIKDFLVDKFARAVELTLSGRRYIDPQLALELAFPRGGAFSLREQQIVDMLLDENAIYATKRDLQS